MHNVEEVDFEHKNNDIQFENLINKMSKLESE